MPSSLSSRASPAHQGRVFGSPWAGVYATHIESARHFGRHWHAVYGVGLIEHGAQSSASGRGHVDAYAGDVIMCNPGEVHDGRPLGGPSRRWRMLYFEPAVIASMVADSPHSPDTLQDIELTYPVTQDVRLRTALQRLLDRLQQWDAGAGRSGADALACEESLVHACALLLHRHAALPVTQSQASSPTSPSYSLLELHRARDHLAADLLAPPTLTELAHAAGLSKFQLLRRFEKAFGLTPHAWLLQQRAERARSLIRSGAGLAQTAAACGFADQSHMTRLFARQFGFTPGAWQQAMGKSSYPSAGRIPLQ
ncbi:helix-turn-helix domain-containing protein [Polaromonas aquatica]|uniref:AraC family ligand binding domain-containing protein n=1 Tax=Polaromonas aquatica TaxID=332657 RepID=UPI003D654E73